MLRHYVVKKHVDDHTIDHLVWHHRTVYTPPLGKLVGFLLWLYVIYFILNRFVDSPNLSLIFGLVGMAFYIKWIIDFLNLYLDCMVLTPRWIVVFKWEGLLEYKTDTFSRERIETVSHTQDSLADKILSKWNVIVTLEHGVVYHFNNVPSPMKQANLILSTRDSYLLDEEDDDDPDKFGLLVETLWEVIHDYMKWRKKEQTSSRYGDESSLYDY